MGGDVEMFWSLADGSKTTAFNAGAPLAGNRFVVADDGSITFPTTAASPGAVSPDRTLLAAPPTGAGAPSGQIRITRVADNSLVTILGTADVPARLPVAWSPDGTRLVTGGREWTYGGDLLFWKTATWLIAKSISGDTDASKVVFSPDGRSLLVNGSAEAAVLDVATGARKVAFPISAYSSCVAPFDIAYSPDGDVVASASLAGTFIWSPIDGHLVSYLPSPSDKQIAFTSNRSALELGGRSDRLRPTGFRACCGGRGGPRPPPPPRRTERAECYGTDGGGT